MEFSECLNDNSLGPTVQGCRGDFDFTLKFEKIFLSILPSSIFIALTLPWAVYLIRKPVIVHGAIFQYTKFTATLIYACLQLALLVLSRTAPPSLAVVLITSSTLAFVAALCICMLSVLEHSRSPRPSLLLGAYLFLTVFFDATQTRSMWLSARTYDETRFVRLFAASTVWKALLIGLESRNKQRWIEWDLKEHSPEESSGLYGLGAFSWLNSLFLTGYNKPLALSDLFPLDINISAEVLQTHFVRMIERADFKGQKNGLVKALAKTLAVPLLLPVAPRIALIGFTFSQPFMLQSLLQFLTAEAEDDDDVSANSGYGLIGAALLIYTGIAVSTAFYWYFQERAMYMVRGVLASAVYRETTQAQLSAADDSAALTLMSADVERIRMGFLNLHEFWANMVEVVFASWLLEQQLGAAFAAPIVHVVICVVITAILARHAGPRQKAWMEKLQKRVGLTANVIGNMKHLKISGLTGAVEDAIQNMRVDELRAGTRFRTIMATNATVGFTPLFLAPVWIFALTPKSLDATIIFTSLSYLLLLTQPLSMLFQAVPNTLAGFTCLGRIQAFLEKQPRHDFREHGQPPSSSLLPEMASLRKAPPPPAIRVMNASFGWQDGQFNLKDITVTIPRSKLSIVVGPVASGKSTLCKGLLGETTVFQGRVVLDEYFRRVGYCDQTSFLINATVRENIVGFSPFDEKRYAAVIEASMLAKDMSLFPLGDASRVGSNGITLSGGQKQRVSIARALYLEADLVVFDDVLSGLDADTEEQVFNRAFGPTGLLKQRGATAILCTHSVRHLPSADHIIALDVDGRVVEEGTFDDLMANKKYVHSLGISRSGTSATPASEESDLWIAPAETVVASVPDTAGDQNRERRSYSLYRYYFNSIGSFRISCFLVVGAAVGTLYNWPTIWLKMWSDELALPRPAHSDSYYIGLYALFEVLGTICFFFCIILVLIIMVVVSGAKMHRAALRTVITAPLRFFTTTDSGVVTNLFSQDLSLLDNELPQAQLNVALSGFMAIGEAAVIATTSPYVAISYPFIGVILYAIQRFYLRTSRQLRLLDLEAKSPLYTHFLDTIKGVATFRAFDWVPDILAQNNKLLDTSQRPAYLLAMIQRWLGFVMDIMVTILAVLVVTLATQLRSSSGFTGASLVTVMSLGGQLNSIIVFYTQLETSLGAVSRLKSFSETTKSEDQPGEDIVPDEAWPLKGRIEIRGVSASYDIRDSRETPEDATGAPNTETSLALRDLNLTIEPGQKVAICGRSGSGKSSTILLLLRLLDPLTSPDANHDSNNPHMTIDGLPLATVDRATLRRRLIAVPQDAVFLPDGTSFRANLDPYAAAQPDDCRAVLEAVDLWNFVAARGGLETGMHADALSQGQKQLFSLARAMLRRRVRARVAAGEVGAAYLATRMRGGGGGGGGGDRFGTDSKKEMDKDAPSKADTDAEKRGNGEMPGESEETKTKDTGGEDGIGVGGGVLLLDEVSSSVDVETDQAMQKIIQREFDGYTIVVVSHRLDMVMDFDQVLVMDAGVVVEAGSPRELVKTPGSRFRDLWLVGKHE